MESDDRRTPGSKRVLIKISGEMLMGEEREGINSATISRFADDLLEVKEAGYEIGIVVGGGNIMRGVEGAAMGIGEVQAHYMGMIATIINALALQSILEKKGAYTRVMSALHIDAAAEPYIRRRAMRHMEKGRIVIFAAGSGNPFFTTDSAGALRAVELRADMLVKATKVDGIYTADPMKDPKAKHLPKISFKQVMDDDLGVMDAAAISVCRQNNMPILVCSMKEKGNLLKALQGKARHTLVSA